MVTLSPFENGNDAPLAVAVVPPKGVWMVVTG